MNATRTSLTCSVPECRAPAGLLNFRRALDLVDEDAAAELRGDVLAELL